MNTTARTGLFVRWLPGGWEIQCTWCEDVLDEDVANVRLLSTLLAVDHVCVEEGPF